MVSGRQHHAYDRDNFNKEEEEDKLRQRLLRRRNNHTTHENFSLSSAVNQHHHHHHDHSTCGFSDPSLVDRAGEEIRTRAALGGARGRHLQVLDCNRLRNHPTTIEIPVHLHLTTVANMILHPNDAVDRFIDESPDFNPNDEFSSPADIEALFQVNIDVLNDAFADTSFHFTFVRARTTVTNNFDWTFELEKYQTDISRAVGSNDLRQLDVFVAYSLMDPVDDIVLRGMAIPGAVQRRGTGDGVYITYEVLPQAKSGDGLGGYEMGYVNQSPCICMKNDMYRTT